MFQDVLGEFRVCSRTVGGVLDILVRILSSSNGQVLKSVRLPLSRYTECLLGETHGVHPDLAVVWRGSCDLLAQPQD